MPIYEFACQSCQQEFEMLVPSHRTTVACPRCRSGDVEKLFSAFAVRGGGRSMEFPPGSAGAGGGCCGGG